MPKYDPKTVEQQIDLPDGRSIFKTHNGFECYVMDKNGVVTPVTQEYYLKAKRTKTKNNGRNKRNI